jgi:ribonuclease HII
MNQFEKMYLNKGYQYIAGCDEVGRGPLAGPVVVACVILDPNKPIDGLNDSKKLSKSKRDSLSEIILEKAVSTAIVYIDHDVVDQINVLNASKQGMLMALKKLSISPDVVLSDAIKLDLDIINEAIIKGDSKSISIAAASIIAKVSRDEHMVKMDLKYPGYGFAKHKGYPTKEHIKQLNKLGPCKIHRKSFKPVQDSKQEQMKLFNS